MLGYCFFSESACPLSAESFVPCITPRFLILLVGWARLVPSCEFKVEAGNVFHFAKLLKMKGIARSQKRLQIWGSFWLRNCRCWSLELIALGHIEFKQIDVEGKMLCCATWMMLALPGKPFCGCYVLYVSSCFWKSSFDLLSWGLVERFVVGLQVVQRGCSCDGGGRALVSPVHTFLRSRINLLNLISSSPLFHDNCKFLCIAGRCPMPSGGFATKVMVRPGLRRRRRCGGVQASFQHIWRCRICWVCRFALKIFGAQKGGRETPRLRIVKLRWNLGGTAAFWPYQ